MVVKNIHKIPLKCRLSLIFLGKEYYRRGICMRGCKRCAKNDYDCWDCECNAMNLNYIKKGTK